MCVCTICVCCMMDLYIKFLCWFLFLHPVNCCTWLVEKYGGNLTKWKRRLPQPTITCDPSSTQPISHKTNKRWDWDYPIHPIWMVPSHPNQFSNQTHAEWIGWWATWERPHMWRISIVVDGVCMNAAVFSCSTFRSYRNIFWRITGTGMQLGNVPICQKG
jgi:hypothetical protein